MRRHAKLLATLAALVAAAGLAAALAGCGFSSYQAGTAPDPEAIAKAANLVVLDSGAAPNRYAGGTTAMWYAVGRPGSDEVKALVFVLRFSSEEARDVAYARVTYRMNRGLTPNVVYTAGDAVIEVSRIGDYGTVQDLNRALGTAGAK